MTQVALALAHAPAVLRGPRHAGAHPAVGAAACAQGLLRHGGAPPGVPVGQDDLQPRAVAARAARGLRRRIARTTGIWSSASSPRTTLTSTDIAFMLENFFHAQRRAHDRASIRGTRSCWRSGAGPRRDAGPRRTTVHRGRPARSAGVAEARLDRSVLPRGRRPRARPGRRRAGSSRKTTSVCCASRARAAERRHSRLSGRGRPRTGRALDVAVLPPDPAAALRHGDLQAHASRLADAAAAVPASGGRGRAACDAPSRCHERLFGRRPVGMWPSEGSVSDAMVPLVAAGPVSVDGHRRADSGPHARDHVLARRPRAGRSARTAVRARTRSAAGGAQVACAVPRPHALGSDWLSLRRLGRRGRRRATSSNVSPKRAAGTSSRTGGGEAVIPIILDGENAWEHFEGGGRPFLRALYRRLSRPPGASDGHRGRGLPARPGGADRASSPAPGSTPISTSGSAIADDHRAWSQLADAREALDVAGGGDVSRALARAREEMLIAEGSDWFWWYGDDHSSDHDMEFDDLFRRHLRNVYRPAAEAGAGRALRRATSRRARRRRPTRSRRRSSRRRSTAKRRATSSGSARAAGGAGRGGGDAPDRRAGRRC